MHLGDHGCREAHLSGCLTTQCGLFEMLITLPRRDILQLMFNQYVALWRIASARSREILKQPGDVRSTSSRAATSVPAVPTLHTPRISAEHQPRLHDPK